MTTEDLTLLIPVREGQHLAARRIVGWAVLPFGVFGTAMFAEPAVTEIEKVIGLSQESGGVESLLWCRPDLQTGTSRRYCLRVPRLTSGP